MSKKLRVVLDADAILADFMGGLWEAIYKDCGVEGDTALVTGWDKIDAGLARPLPLGRKAADYFLAPGFFLGLKPLPGAITAVKALLADGHEVVVATTPCSPHSASEKIQWFAKHFPFLDQKNIFIGHKKYMIQGDVLVDDGLHNAEDFRKHQPASVLTIAYPYNQDDGRVFDLRAEGYQNTTFAWGQILERIRAIAERP